MITGMTPRRKKLIKLLGDCTLRDLSYGSGLEEIDLAKKLYLLLTKNSQQDDKGKSG